MREGEEVEGAQGAEAGADAGDEVAAEAEVAKPRQRVEVLDALDLVEAEVEVREVRQRVQALDAADRVVVELQGAQQRQAAEVADLDEPREVHAQLQRAVQVRRRHLSPGAAAQVPAPERLVVHGARPRREDLAGQALRLAAGACHGGARLRVRAEAPEARLLVGLRAEALDRLDEHLLVDRLGNRPAPLRERGRRGDEGHVLHARAVHGAPPTGRRRLAARAAPFPAAPPECAAVVSSRGWGEGE